MWIRAIHPLQAMKHASKGFTLALKFRADITRSPKRGYQWPRNGLMSSKIKKINIFNGISCVAIASTTKSFRPKTDLRFVEEWYRSDGLESSIVCPCGIDSTADPVKFIYLKEIEHSLSLNDFITLHQLEKYVYKLVETVLVSLS